jgi:predicted protein tyrosine phosphatase
MTRVLFICSRNRFRSPTAEEVFALWPGVETDSAGLAYDADTPLDAAQVEWAKRSYRDAKAQRGRPIRSRLVNVVPANHGRSQSFSARNFDQ